MPRSTRRPATVSVPSVVRRPSSSRCAACRACSGRSAGPSSRPKTGTPTSTTLPSSGEADSSSAATSPKRDDRTGTAGGDVQAAGDAERVGRADADDLTGRRAPPQVRAEPQRRVGRPLRGAEVRGQEGRDGEAVPADAGRGLHHAERQQRPRPHQQRPGPSRRPPRGRRPVRARTAPAPGRPSTARRRRRRRRWCAHCSRATRSRKRAGVRRSGDARVGQREGLHVGPRYGRGPGRVASATSPRGRSAGQQAGGADREQHHGGHPPAVQLDGGQVGEQEAPGQQDEQQPGHQRQGVPSRASRQRSTRSHHHLSDLEGLDVELHPTAGGARRR